ncbi:hypothetical protein GCM10027435_28000 [Haloparvum alkalitolerans]
MLIMVITIFAEAHLYRTALLGVTMTDSDRRTMKDVSHTAPNDTSADAVWGRGRDREPEEEEEE